MMLQWVSVALLLSNYGLVSSLSTTSSRREVLASSIAWIGSSQSVSAAVTDETKSFAETWWSSSSSSSSSSDTTPTASTATDEVVFQVSKQQIQARRLGLELADIEFKTNLRVYVKSVQPGSLASELGIQKDWIFIGVNGQSTERTNAEGVAIFLSRALQESSRDTVELRFRDPSIFRNKLQTLGADELVSTQVAPAGDTTQRFQDGSVRPGQAVTEQVDQTITVSQLVPPKICSRGAQVGDLLEISYIGTVVESGEIFDGSAIKINGQAVPGRGDDVTLFFVLGKQPFGQFPPSFSIGLESCCVGERRRLIVPPALAYGSKGLPRRGIPPDATLQYDVTVVSLNGLATPQ